MKFLVLGSAGQIGSALCKYLQQENHEVIEFDISKNAEEDLRIPGQIDTLLEKVDFVFFLAFDVGGSTYLKTYQNTYNFLDNNTRLMINVFNSLQESKTPFIFASSQMSNMAFSPYGTLKNLGEFYTKTLGGVVVKFWNVYGIETDPEKTHVITDFVQAALNNKEIKIKTDGTEKRQFLFVDDCCEALLKIALKYDKIEKNIPLEITSFVWYEIIYIAKKIAHLCNNSTVIYRGEVVDTVQQGKHNEPSNYVEWNLDWRPKTYINEGLQKIIDYYKNKIS